MGYTLQDFCAEIHDILVTENNLEGRENVRKKLVELLQNDNFVESFCGAEKTPGVYKLNEDPVTGAVVLSHVMGEGRTSPPHDHGNSWAIYGQATEYTIMTEFELISEELNDDGPILTETKKYRLDPGQVGLFDIGKIHSIEYPDGARFVRVTGVDLDYINRKAYNLERNTVKTIKAESAVRA